MREYMFFFLKKKVALAAPRLDPHTLSLCFPLPKIRNLSFQRSGPPPFMAICWRVASVPGRRRRQAP